jgi:hypothetical protein
VCVTPEHKNVHFLREDTEHEQPSVKQETSAEYKKATKAEGEFTKLPLDPRVPDRTVCVGSEMKLEEQAELLQFLDKNNDVFAESTSDLIGVSREVIEHRLQVNPMQIPRSRSSVSCQKRK